MNKPPFDPGKPFSPLDSKPPFDPNGPSQNSDGPDYSQVAKDAINEAMVGKGSRLRDLLSDPVTQAKVLPYLSGAAGAVLPVPMGAMMGTVGGRQLSNLALKTYGRSGDIPSTGSQVLEAGMAGLGDLTAIPMIKKNVYGSAIGDAEKAAGVPPLEEIKSLPRPTGPKSVSELIDDSFDDVATRPDAQKNDPVFWKQLKDQVDWLYQRGKDEALSNIDKIKLSKLSAVANQGLNSSVPGRGEIASDMSSSLGAPRAISNAWKSIPPKVRAGLQYFGPGAAIAGGLHEVFRTIGGGGGGR